MRILLQGERPPVSIASPHTPFDLAACGLNRLILETDHPSIANASRYVTPLMEDIPPSGNPDVSIDGPINRQLDKARGAMKLWGMHLHHIFARCD
jgi:hypothetical protein